MVADVFSQDVHEDGVSDVVEASLDVSFEEPCGPYPYVVYCGSGRMASPFRSASVAVVRAVWFVGRFQDGPYYFLNYFR